MAYKPQQVSVSRMPAFESKTAGYLQDLQTAGDKQVAIAKADARLDRQETRLGLQDKRAASRDQLAMEQQLWNREHTTAQDKATADQRLFTNNRATTLDTQQQAQVALQNQRAADKVARDQGQVDAAWTVAQGNIFTRSDYENDAPELLQGLKNIEADRDAAVAYLQSGNDDSQNSRGVAANAYKYSIGGDYNSGDVIAKAQQRMLELDEYRLKVSAATTPEAKKALVDKFVGTMYTPTLNVLTNNIAAGKGLPTGLRIQILAGRKVSEDTQRLLSPSDVARIHKAATVNSISKDALYTKETARLNAEYDQQTEKIRWANEYLKRKQDAAKKYSGSSKGSSTGTLEGMKQAMEDVAAIDLSRAGDRDEAKEGYQALVEKHHISPEIAAMTVKWHVENGVLGKDFPGVSNSAFDAVVTHAEALQKAFSSKSDGKGGTSYTIDEDKFRHHASKRRTPEDYLKERFYAGSASSAVVPLSPEARDKIKGIIKNNPALSGANSDQYGNVTPPDGVKGTVDDVRGTTSVDILTPKSIPHPDEVVARLGGTEILDRIQQYRQKQRDELAAAKAEETAEWVRRNPRSIQGLSILQRN